MRVLVACEFSGIMKQSRTLSLIESATNVVVGYVLAIATQLAVFPLFGIETGLGEHMTIGLAFVGVSLARGYVLRRMFENLDRRRGDARQPDEVKRACDRSRAMRASTARSRG